MFIRGLAIALRTLAAVTTLYSVCFAAKLISWYLAQAHKWKGLGYFTVKPNLVNKNLVQGMNSQNNYYLELNSFIFIKTKLTTTPN